MTTPSYNSPSEAEAVFYEAFDRGDLEILMSVWHTDDNIECIHPAGPRIQGYRDIHASWEEVLQQSGTVQVETQPLKQIEGADVAVRHVMEVFRWQSDNDDHELSVVATNVFRRFNTGWRLVLHHASPYQEDESEMDVLRPALH